MAEGPISFQFKPLRQSGSDQDYQLYRAALEWDLDDPIVIEDRNVYGLGRATTLMTFGSAN